MVQHAMIAKTVFAIQFTIGLILSCRYDIKEIIPLPLTPSLHYVGQKSHN